MTDINYIIYLTITLILVVFTINFEKPSKNIDNYRKGQLKDRLSENVLRKKLDSMLEQKVKVSKRRQIELLAVQAGFKFSYGDITAIRVVLAGIFFLTISLVLNNPVLGLIFAFLGYSAPIQALDILKNKRVNALEAQVGPFLSMTLKRYESTKDLNQSLKLTAKEFEGEEPMYSELKSTILDIETGVETGLALKNLGIRSGNKYLKRFADYYEMSEFMGTDKDKYKLLSEALNQYEENRKMMLKLKKEISGPVREGYILIASVPAIALYQAFANEGYVEFMTQTSTGKIGSTVIISVLMGCIWFVNKKIGAPIDK